MRLGYCQVKNIVIGSHVNPYYEDVKRIYKPKNIINDVRKEFGVNKSYLKAWWSRDKALDMIWGGCGGIIPVAAILSVHVEVKKP